MTGVYATRVLVTEGTTPETAARQLRKIADWIETSGFPDWMAKERSGAVVYPDFTGPRVA